MATFSLLGIIRKFVKAMNPEYLLMKDMQALAHMGFTRSVLHMLIFCFGGIFFYFPLTRHESSHAGFLFWGLITVFPCLIPRCWIIFGVQIPFFVYLPLIPFELVIAVWIHVKGIREVRV
jgi:hypothetical protein